MTLEEDIKTIQDKLTGDKKKDIDILFSCVDEYATRPYAKEINIKISDLLQDMLKDSDPEMVAMLSQYIQEQSSRKYDNKLLKIKDLMGKEKYEEALKLADELESQVQLAIKEAQLGYPEKPLTFRFVFSVMESALAAVFYPADNVVSLPFDYVSLLTLKSQTYFALSDYDKSFLTLRTAMEYDPVSPDLSFLMAEMQESMGNYISFKMALEKAKRFLYRREDYQRYFMLIAKYYESYLKDKKFADKLRRAVAKIDSPIKMTRKIDAKMKARLKEEGFQVGLSDEVQDTLIEYMKLALKENNDEIYMHCFKVISEFLTDKQITALLEEGNKKTQSV